MKLTKIFMLTALVTILAEFAGAQTHKSALLQYDKQIDGILSQMTLEEKVNMLHAKHMFISARYVPRILADEQSEVGRPVEAEP